jgi:glycosyltransferase involved in cell wall biosynthesis
MPLPPVAIVVIGRNEGANLDRCFRSVRGLDYPPELLELIFVDSGSTDSSIAVAEQWDARVIALHQPPFTAARGRQAGWQATAVPFVMFLDGDCAVAPGFLRAAIEQLQDPKVAIVWGELSEVNPTRSFLREMISLAYRGLPTGPGSLVGGNHVCRRAALDAVGGFDVTLDSMESTTLAERVRDLGYLVVKLDTPSVEHLSPIDGPQRWFLRGFRFGYGDSRYLAANPPARRRFRENYDIGPRLTDSLLFVGFLVLSAASLVVWSWRGLLISAALLAGLVAAKAWMSRHKGVSWTTLLAYGLHTQMFCVPMLAGHLTYWLDRIRGQQRRVDYWRRYDTTPASRSASMSPGGNTQG